MTLPLTPRAELSVNCKTPPISYTVDAAYIFNVHFQLDLTSLRTIEFSSTFLLSLRKDFFQPYHSSSLFNSFNAISTSKITLQSVHLVASALSTAWGGRTGEGGNGKLARKPSQAATFATTACGEIVVLLPHF